MKTLIDTGYIGVAVVLSSEPDSYPTLTFFIASTCDEDGYAPASSATIGGMSALVALRDALLVAYPLKEIK